MIHESELLLIILLLKMSATHERNCIITIECHFIFACITQTNTYENH